MFLAINSSFCDNSNILGVFYIVKVIINLIKVIAPIILIIASMIEIVKYIISSDPSKVPVFKNISQKFIAAAIIYLIPALLNTVVGVVESTKYDETSCWVDANLEKIDELRESEKQADLLAANARLAAREAALKEKLAKRVTETVAPSNGASTVADGVNSLVVKDGIFYLPNKRATSNSETPKGTGQYGLNEEFWGRLNKLMKAANDKGYKIAVTSGWRPYDRQLFLWNNSDRSCSTRAKWIACPGGSRHGYGIAADITYNGKHCDQTNYNCNEAARWAHENAAAYGLRYPMSYEPWHIEPINIQGGKYSTCTQSCK